MGKLAAWLGIQGRSLATPTGVIPPRRAASGPITARETATVPSAYRAIQILTTSASQLSLDAYRNSEKIIDRPPAIVRRPSLDIPRSEWLEQATMSLAATGNLYLAPNRDAEGQAIDLPILNPHHVAVTQNSETGAISYHYQGRKYTRGQILHCALMRLPGQLTGVGPIQAARNSLTFARDLNKHISGWFDTTGQPAGILSSDQSLSDNQARAYRNTWNGLDADGNKIDRTDNPSGIKVLGRGLEYKPILLNPKDALWLEAQTWTALEIARLFGVPSSLMLVAPEGSSRTYSNVNQEWLAFTRFTLMGYLRPIEEALTELAPRGVTIRFNLEALLRADTMSRYQSYQLAAQAGWLNSDEIRTIEGLPNEH